MARIDQLLQEIKTESQPEEIKRGPVDVNALTTTTRINEIVPTDTIPDKPKTSIADLARDEIDEEVQNNQDLDKAPIKALRDPRYDAFQVADATAKKVIPQRVTDVLEDNRKFSEKVNDFLWPEKVKSVALKALSTLGVGEYSAVWAIRSATGLENKRPLKFQEQTYSELYKDLGMDVDKNIVNKSIAFLTSIVGDPLTYVTFGTANLAKKGGGLASTSLKESLKLRNEALDMIKNSKALGAEAVAKKAEFNTMTSLEKAKVINSEAAIIETQGKGLLQRAEKNMKAAQEFDIGLTEKGLAVKNAEVQKRMDLLGKKDLETRMMVESEVKSDLYKIAQLSDGKAIAANFDNLKDFDVARAGKQIFDTGGIKLGQRTLVGGPAIAMTLKKFKIPDMWEAVSTRGPLKGPLTELKRSKDFFKKFFFTSRAETEIAQDANKVLNKALLTADRMQNNFVIENANFFKGLSKKEREQFGDVMIQAVNKEIAIKKGRALSDLDREQIFDFIGNKAGPKVKPKIDKWLTQNKKLAMDAGIPESEVLEFYYPFIIPGKNVPLDPKQFKINIHSPDEGFKISKTTAGDTAIKDPLIALTIIKSKVAAAQISKKAYEEIATKFGTKFKSLVEAEEAGFKRLVGNKELVDHGLIGEADLKKFKDVFVPRDVYEELAEKQITNSVNIPVWSWMTNTWKGNVTTLFPAFHFRNMMSNVMLNSGAIGLHAANPKLLSLSHDVLIQRSPLKTAFGPKSLKAQAKLARKEIKTAAGEKVSLAQLRTELDEQGVIRGFFADDLNVKLDGFKGKTGLEQSFWKKAINDFNFFSTNSLPQTLGRNIGEHIENVGRATNYIHWRMKGVSPEQSARLAIDTLFDYSDLTKGEQWLKQMIPFYTFSRKNIERQVQLLVHKPGYIANQLKFVRDFGPSDEEWELMPEWAQSKMVNKFFGTVTHTGFFPLEEVFEAATLQGLTGRLHPMIKLGAEMQYGKDSFTGRPIEEVNKADELAYIHRMAQDPRNPTYHLAKPIADFFQLDSPDGDNVVGDPDKLLALRSLFTSRYGAMLAFLQKEDKGKMVKAVKAIFGPSIINIDEDQAIYWKNMDVMNEVVRELKAKGLGYDFKKFVFKKSVTINDASRKKATKQFNDFLEKARKQGELLDKKEVFERMSEIIENTETERPEFE